MKITLLITIMAFSALSFSSPTKNPGIEVSKCTTQANEYKFFVLDEKDHCRDLRKSCEFASKFYSLGKGINAEENECIVPFTGRLDTLAKWVESK